MTQISIKAINEANDDLQKLNLIKESLKIVDKLANIDFEDMSAYEKEILMDLIEKASKLKKHRLWKLD